MLVYQRVCFATISRALFFQSRHWCACVKQSFGQKSPRWGEWWRRRSAVRDDMRMVEMQYIYMFTIYLYATSRISMFFLRLSCVLRGMYQSILYITTCWSTIFVDVFWTCLFKIYNNSYHPFFDATLKSSLQIDRVLQQSVSYFDVETWNG